MDGLTEGRIVHFVEVNGQHSAAIVTRVYNKETGMLNLFVLRDDGVRDARFESSIRYAEVAEHGKAEPSTWHWIEQA